MNLDRLPLLMFALLGLVIAAVIGMATGSWVWFGVAFAVHLVASFFVISSSIRTAQRGEESDPRSQRLDRMAGDAVGDRPRNVETELEGLKRE
jgi:membrane protein implicated in regulation of membrane protease activity